MSNCNVLKQLDPTRLINLNTFPMAKYLLKVNNKDIRKKSEICSVY